GAANGVAPFVISLMNYLGSSYRHLFCSKSGVAFFKSIWTDLDGMGVLSVFLLYIHWALGISPRKARLSNN
ncbi:MAG: hypothetical protein ABF743_14720, partial [Schleiferilactobacillus perolens]|uniref:hypothetical protein n=1 Tax=Schleiferilactobacillus perolens TaxID=100468 RepID=UPI0039E93328